LVFSAKIAQMLKNGTKYTEKQCHVITIYCKRESCEMLKSAEVFPSAQKLHNISTLSAQI